MELGMDFAGENPGLWATGRSRAAVPVEGTC